MKFKKAMSLSEVVVCLAVVGVLAMILVPLLTKTTTGKEKFLYKKAINTMQNAVSAVMNDNTVMNSSNFWPELSSSGLDVRDAIAQKIILDGTVNNSANGNSSFTNPDFVSSDGMIWWGLPTSWEQNNAGSSKSYYDVYVDVNGEKGPNTLTTDATNPKDTYVMTFYGTRVVAGIPGKEDGASGAAKTIMMEKKTKESTRSNG